MIEHWNVACMILVTSLFSCHHAMTLTFDRFQGQICCCVGDDNSPNLLGYVLLSFWRPILQRIILPLGVLLIYTWTFNVRSSRSDFLFVCLYTDNYCGDSLCIIVHESLGDDRCSPTFVKFRISFSDVKKKGFKSHSNMTWFFSPIKSTDMNSALFPDKS